MSRLCTAVVVVIVLLSGCSGFHNNPDLTHKQDVEDIQILRIIAVDGNRSSNGTAFPIVHHGKTYLVTAFHVVSNKDHPVYVMDTKKQVLPVKILRRFPMEELDVCLFEVSDQYNVLRPNGVGIDSLPGDLCVTKGISFEERIRTGKGFVDRPRVFSSSFATHGMSGGPVISNGRVIGVISAMVSGETGSVYTNIRDVLLWIDRKGDSAGDVYAPEVQEPVE